jgi:hypothetical protein
MTPEEQNYYENYLDLFMTEGWKQFVSDAGSELNNFHIINITDEKSLYTIQGKLYVLSNIIGLEDTIKNTYEELQNA